MHRPQAWPKGRRLVVLRGSLWERAVELAGLLVEGGSLLDGAEAGDAEGLTGLGDGLGPAADVLERALAVGVLLLGDEAAVLVQAEVALGAGPAVGGPVRPEDAVFWRLPFQTWRRLPRTRTRRAILS